jgi:RNA polymerase sigma-70 factor (ECF subfamily)
MTVMKDTEIIELFKLTKSKEKAFEILIKKYQEPLYWIIRRIVISHEDTDDVLQNTFVKIWKGLDNFKNQSKLFTWLYRIAVNEALTWVNKNKKRVYSNGEINDALIDKLEADVFFDGNEIEKKLQKSILSLPKRQQMVFNMKYYEHLKYNEISEILNVSVGSLKASYHLAVKKIEQYLKTD